MIILLVFLIVFVICGVLRVPIAFSILSGGIAAYFVGGLNVNGIPSALLASLDSFPLLAIPAFIFAGELMSQGGISRALVRFIQGLVGRARGSLGAVTIITSALFGAITGSSVATVSAIGGIMTPEMVREGYDRKYICAIIAGSGILGTLIPPSIPGVQYALIAGLKLTDVWMSTLVPGIVLTVAYCLANYLYYGRHQEKRPKPIKIPHQSSARTLELKESTPKALVAFIMPLIIFGGVYGGVFTATEAGAISVVYALIAGWIIYPLIFKQKADVKLFQATRHAASSALTIGILICTATVVSRSFALSGVSTQLANVLLNVSSSKVLFLICVNVLLIVVGMFLETNSGILLFGPILAPIAEAYGVDPLQFGAILLVNLEIGLLTPPFAGNLFVGCKITKTTIDQVMKPMLVFYSCCIPVLALTTFVPSFSMWLPHFLAS